MRRWWIVAAIVAALLLVLWYANRNTLPRTVGGAHATTTGSILDSANAGASKVKALFATIFGSKKSDDEDDDA